MAKKLIKWKVEEAPTGAFSSFQHRGWPKAMYNTPDEKMAGWIRCADDYSGYRARNGGHAPLTLHVCDYRSNDGKWVVRKLKGEFATLAEAKARFDEFLAKFPDFMPKES